MKTSALTIRLEPELERRLAEAAERSGKSRSEFVETLAFLRREAHLVPEGPALDVTPRELWQRLRSGPS